MNRFCQCKLTSHFHFLFISLFFLFINFPAHFFPSFFLSCCQCWFILFSCSLLSIFCYVMYMYVIHLWSNLLIIVCVYFLVMVYSYSWYLFIQFKFYLCCTFFFYSKCVTFITSYFTTAHISFTKY